ncbi:MAG: hypothetical protein ACKEQI_00800 [Candidatus Hodgkinia cicadicola]
MNVTRHKHDPVILILTPWWISIVIPAGTLIWTKWLKPNFKTKLWLSRLALNPDPLKTNHLTCLSLRPFIMLKASDLIPRVNNELIIKQLPLTKPPNDKLSVPFGPLIKTPSNDTNTLNSRDK